MRIAVLTMLAATVAVAQSVSPQKDIPSIAKAANGAVVSIIMSDKDGRPIAQGSGFVVSKDGHIITNYHVIQSGSSAIVKLPDGAFYAVDGVLASDKARDVAVIKVGGESFRTLPLGNSDGVQVGDQVVAIGNPLSLESTVSNGIVSGIRTVQVMGGKLIQVTTPVSPGSSGGPLFNMGGQVIGITTFHLKGGENLNFAIPINDTRRLLSANPGKLQDLPNEPEPIEARASHGEVPPSPVGKAQHLRNILKIQVYPIWLYNQHEHKYFLSDIQIANNTPETIQGITLAIARAPDEQPEYIKFSIWIEPGKYSFFSKGERQNARSADGFPLGRNGCSMYEPSKVMYCGVSPGFEDVSDNSQIRLKDYEAAKRR